MAGIQWQYPLQYPPRLTWDPQTPGEESKLDEIHVAGGVRIAAILHLANTVDRPWARLLEQTMTSGIPLRSENQQKEKGLFSGDKWSNNLELLRGWHVLRETSAPRNDIIFGRYFQVPKKGNVWRAIFNCVPQGKVFARPPILRLICVKELITILGIFIKPICGTADLRHWFYQIELPENLRHSFSVGTPSLQRKGCRMELLVWPMGFSWSPWVAQCIATLIVVGLHPNAKGHDLSFETDEHITSVIRCKDSLERIIAVIILFYDNFLIVAESRRVYDKVKSKITACAAFLGAKWKMTPDAADPFLKADSEGWLVFLGFRFKTDAHMVTWQHSTDNIAEWKDLNVEVPTPRKLASLIGLAVWNCTMRMLSYAQIALIIYLGKRFTPASDEDAEAWDLPTVVLAPEQSLLLRTFMENLLANPTESFLVKDRYPVDTIALASDASNLRAAWLKYQLDGSVLPNDVHVWTFSEAEARRTIFWKESSIALMAVQTNLKAIPPATPERGLIQFRIAIDNTAACSAIKSCYSSDIELCEEWCNWKRDCQRRTCSLLLSRSALPIKRQTSPQEISTWMSTDAIAAGPP